ncbi:hypothetical protein KJ909_01355, partial [Patescibacteria group bacterium]|nr:hypothetical protein [Patescibacteria group bacterium]
IEMAMPKLKGVIDLFEGLRDSGVVGGGTGESATVFVRMVDMTESYERNGRYNRGRKEENCLFPGVVLCFDFWGTDGRDDGFSHGYSKVTAYVDQERLMIVGCLSWMSKVVENPSDLNTVVAKAILDPERVDIFNGWPLDWGPG